MANNSDIKLLPWSTEKKLSWFNEQRVKRSYHDDVLVGLEALVKSGRPSLVVEKYGSLTLNPDKYPLYSVRCGNRPELPTVLITGGVHGYETSGVKGALQFLDQYALSYTERFNFLIAPCVSPWSYETINRLNPVMENPNREFKKEGRAEESRLLMDYLTHLNVKISAHLDLHETTDSDRVFLPEEYSKNGLVLEAKDIDIPDGFYLIGTKGFSRPDLENAMIDSVRKVTHIAKPDERGMILDTPISLEGVVHTSVPGLCAEFTGANSALGAYTTEMYPDSESFKAMGAARTESICNDAQVACIRGALDFFR